MFTSGPWLISVGIPTAIAQRADQPLLVRNLSIALGFTWLTVLLEFSCSVPTRRHSTAPRLRVSCGRRRPEPPKTVPMPTRSSTAPEHLVTMVNRLREAREKLAAQVGRSVESAKLRSLQRQVIRQERLAAVGVSVSPPG